MPFMPTSVFEHWPVPSFRVARLLHDRLRVLPPTPVQWLFGSDHVVVGNGDRIEFVKMCHPAHGKVVALVAAENVTTDHLRIPTYDFWIMVGDESVDPPEACFPYVGGGYWGPAAMLDDLVSFASMRMDALLVRLAMMEVA